MRMNFDDEQTIEKEWCFQGRDKWGSLMRGLWSDVGDWLNEVFLEKNRLLRRVSWENISEGRNLSEFEEMSMNSDF